MTAPTLFDATCPACGGSTEITLAFLKAKSGLMRCRQCQHIFDGFADDSLLCPAVPAVHAPAVPLAVRVDSSAPVLPPVYTPQVQNESSASCAPAAPLRAPRVIRFLASSAPHEEPGHAVSADAVQHEALLIEMKPIGDALMAPASPVNEVVANSASLSTLSEPGPQRIEVRKRGLVPNREAHLTAAETGATSLDVCPPGLSGEQQFAAKNLVAANLQGCAHRLDPVGVQPVPLIGSMVSGSAREGVRGQSTEGNPSAAESDLTGAENYKSKPLGIKNETPSGGPVLDLTGKEAGQEQDVLSEQFDLLFVDVELRIESPSHVIVDEPSQPSAPPRARTPRLAPLSKRDLTGELAADAETLISSESAPPVFKEPGTVARGVEVPSEAVALRPSDAQLSAAREPIASVESRKMEPRKIAPREIGRAPEVVGQQRESRSWAWGSLGAGPTALDRARARLAPPVAWIKKAAPPRREILPNWSGWVILSACVAGLAIQVARVERDTIYSRAPWARTGMALMCQIAGCKPGFAMAKEQLELEAAQVRADSEGRLVFTANFKNKAPYESLAPRLWISIEGEDGKSMASRTFASSEWLGTTSVKGSSEIEAKLVFAAPGKTAAGYKAELVLESPH